MTYLEKKVLGGMTPDVKNLKICKLNIELYKSDKRGALNDYMSTSRLNENFDEFDRITRLCNYMIAVYEARVEIINNEIRIANMEVVHRLV